MITQEELKRRLEKVSSFQSIVKLSIVTLMILIYCRSTNHFTSYPHPKKVFLFFPLDYTKKKIFFPPIKRLIQCVLHF